ncbi:hypothetical protein D9M69_691790 [compost metagenome]
MPRDHDEHAEQCVERQGEHFSAAGQHVAVASVAAAIDQRGEHGQCRKALEPLPHRVAHHHVVETPQCFAAGRTRAQQVGDHCEGQQREHIGGIAQARLDTHVHQRDHGGHD